MKMYWDENDLLLTRRYSILNQIKETMREFKKVDVLCIGLIEGITLACLNIFLFSWTPILKQSTEKGMNPGLIFTSMTLTMIVGTKCCKLFINCLFGMG